ncbi:MAG: SDR family oxidoreductase [Hyphomicrobiaceae bacterium]|nr:SDR family oxidoreductase [Hyphomicrobiaceae bacterium]
MADRGVAVVTGGSAGIGAALVERFLDDGFEVVSLARRAAPDRARLKNMSVDLLDPLATRAAAQTIAASYAVSHLVHNAGIIRANSLEHTSTEDLAALSQLHLGAALTLTQAIVPAMKAKGFGRIILMSSRAANGLQTRTVYSATKSGMVGMARTWAMELGGHGVTVNVVAPGPIGGTEMFHDVMPEGDPRIAALASNIPVKRIGTPEDVVNAVMFFAAPSAGFVTGQLLYVCGGASLGALTL